MIVRKEVRYCRDAVAFTEAGKCDECGVDCMRVLVVDTSVDSSTEGEYGPIKLCHDCVELLFQHPHPEKVT